MKALIIALLAGASFIFPVYAYAADGVKSADRGWGTISPEAPLLQSSLMHSHNGNVAGQANAARAGTLLGGSVSITTIGTQNVISNTVQGNNNDIDVDADQNGINSGDISTKAKIGEITIRASE